MPPDAPETVVAYHRLRLRKIRSLYDQLDPDPDHYLGVERGVSRDIDTLEVQFSEVRETLISLGVDLDANGTIQTPIIRSSLRLRRTAQSNLHPPSTSKTLRSKPAGT